MNTLFGHCLHLLVSHAGVSTAKDDTVPGLYVCGWLKRGPTGIIGTNLSDAEETVDSMIQDYACLQHSNSDGGRMGLRQLLQQRKVQVVDYSAWECLNDYEL